MEVWVEVWEVGGLGEHGVVSEHRMVLESMVWCRRASHGVESIAYVESIVAWVYFLDLDLRAER